MRLRSLFQTSAKTNVNIERAFIDLSEAILEKTPDISKPGRFTKEYEINTLFSKYILL